MFEKAGKYAEAALYYHRALRGLQEFYVPFWWGEPSKAREEYQRLPGEYEDRMQKNMDLGGVSPAERQRMELINDLWLEELLDQEEGGVRPATGRRAVEAEKHGDFRLAEVLRRGEARFYRVAAIPYHEKKASECEKQGGTSEATLHRQAVKAYEQRAVEADMLARGDKALLKLRGLGGPSPWTGVTLYPKRINPVSIRSAYAQRILSGKGEWKTSKTPQEVASILKAQGLHHTDESARFSAVTVLANLGEKEALVSALTDTSGLVRLATARALAATRWADGWAACYNHPDADVRATVESLVQRDSDSPLSRTYVITVLIHGLDSSSAETRSFCQSSLKRITGKKMQANEWSGWWNSLGNARPGLTRTGPGVHPEVDAMVDFGAWWQSGHLSIQNRPNPLLKYSLPATIQWHGHLVVPQTGNYRFYVRNRGEGIGSGKRVHTPGRMGFPGLYFSEPCVKLMIDGKVVVSDASDVMEDPAGGVRIDFSQPVQLDEGLHEIQLEFDIRSYDDLASASHQGIVGGQPCVRLYWSSEHFLRELLPANHLIHFINGNNIDGP